MNQVWGKDLRAADPSAVLKQLQNGLKNKNPKSYLAHAMRKKKTIRFGNKSDPFQPVEKKLKVSLKLLRVLIKLEWTFVIQTRFTSRLMEYEKWILEADKKNLVTLMPVISPGFYRDWEILERKRTTPPRNRLDHMSHFISKGVPVGINGEPFIPGFHNVLEFEEMMMMLKHRNIKSYNTYNFHFTPYVAKRLHAIGIDIEKIYYANKDEAWRPVLRQLCDISKKYGIRLGCPDFVNTGWKWKEEANTCCGINVPNPCTGNTHHWKQRLQNNENEIMTLENTFEGIGDWNEAYAIVNGHVSNMYTMRDAK